MKKGSVALTNGNVLTLDTNRHTHSALLIDNGIITILDHSSALEKMARQKGIVVINLQGKTVIPGAIDTHFHFLQTGMHLSSVDLNLCRSIQEVIDVLQEHAATCGPDQWILGKGLDEFKIMEKRPPTAQELDVAFEDMPIFLEDRGLHYCQLNTLAFKKLRIPPGAPGVRKLSDGRSITGQIMEESVGMARHRLFQQMNKEYKRQILFEAARYAASCGITTLHAMEGGELFGDGEIPLLLEIRDDLPIKISVHWNTFNVEAVQKADLRVLGGDILLDGALGSHTAALSYPYSDDPGSVGMLYHQQQDIEKLARECLDAGIQVGLHAIGDRAIEQALSAFEAVAKGNHTWNGCFRIDHFGLPDPIQVRRAADLSVVIASQPTFPYRRGGPGSVYESRLGSDRERRAYPFREFFDAGLLVAGGSDSVVLPADLMLGIHGCVNHPHETQRLTVDEAIRLYTVNPARFEYKEDVKGILSIGNAGDLTVLDKNPYDVDPREIENILVMMTVVNGLIVYDRSSDRRGEIGSTVVGLR